MASKGYVVRRSDGKVRPASDLADACAEWAAGVVYTPDGEAAIYQVHPDGREERLPSYEEALGEIERIKAPVIGRVSHDCGDATCPRRGPVIESPTCKRAEEFERQISPLAALEAAERRLLEAGGWTIAEPDEYGGERWNHEEAGKEARSTAIVIARRMAEIERRRLAAKGGA